MHPDQEALYRGILAHPHADLPRLVYADWLEENGRAERAEFIRVQIDLANSTPADDAYCDLVEREIELTAILTDELRAERAQLTDGRAWQHRRGMPDQGGPPNGLWPTAAQLLQHEIPCERVTGLQLTDPTDDLAAVIAGRTFPILTHLRVEFGLTSAQIQFLNDESWAPNLTSVTIASVDCSFAWPESGPLLERPLRELVLDSHRGSCAAFTHLLRSPALRTLRRLRIGGGVTPATVLGELMRDGQAELPELRQLEVHGGFHGHSLRLLAQAPFWESMTSFTLLGGSEGGTDDWVEFFRDLRALELRQLTLTGPIFQHKGGLAFAANRSLANLRVLSLSAGKLSATAFRAILAAPQLRNLMVLKLCHAGAKKEYEALADPAVFPHARRIEIRERNLPPAIAEKLRARRGLELRDF